MLNLAIRATNHVAAWLVWQSMRVSLLDDLDGTAQPGTRARSPRASARGA